MAVLLPIPATACGRARREAVPAEVAVATAEEAAEPAGVAAAEAEAAATMTIDQ